MFFTETANFLSKDSNLCPSGNVVQTIVQNGSDSVPPGRNWPYLGPGELISNSPQACDKMGTDPATGWYFGDGNLSSLNSGPDSHLKGYIRAFSSSTILNSAYFGNSLCDDINDSGSPTSNNDITNNVVVDIVNPAYIITFNSDPANGATIGSVEGVVNSSVSAGNNILDSSWILIEWRSEASSTWIPGVNVLDNNGSFIFFVNVPQKTNIYIRARVKNENTPLDGFPISSEFSLEVDSISSFAPIIIITNHSPIIVGFDKNEQIIGGTNLFVDGNLSWSNSLAPGTFLSTSFPINIDNLLVGENIITVFGHNQYNWKTNDSISIVREPEPVPFINITNHSPIVVDFPNNQIIGGTNFNIVGDMSWSNSQVPADNFFADFPVNISGLVPGNNIITVFGTNLLGSYAQDSISIFQKSEPLPFIKITNPSPIIVEYGLTQKTIGGTNFNVVGDMGWLNSKVPGVNFCAGFPIDISGLELGDNLITVFGTNQFGSYAQDIISIVRQNEKLPVINITNASPIIIPFDFSEQMVGGVKLNVAGDLMWSNSLFHALNFISDFPININHLVVGENIITVFGSNKFNYITNDSISIIRLPEPLPVINITNASTIAIPFELSEQIIGGVKLNVAGGLIWSNSLSYGLNFAADFPINIDDLLTGVNVITVFGTNKFNSFTNDSISIIREPEPLPLINITNASPIFLPFSVSEQIIGGISFNIYGDMNWSNSLVAGYFQAPNFPVVIHNLNVGENIIYVFGSNKFNSKTFDSISVFCESEPLPFIEITNSSPINLDYLTTETVIRGTNVNVVGNLGWINNLVGLTNWVSDFNITITNLQLGNNIITVFGENVFGSITNDSILVRRSSQPVVTINFPTTNKIWIANSDQILIGGTLFDNIDFNGGRLIVSNENSGSWFYTTPDNNWGPELTEVALHTNIINAIYYNRLGQKTSDWIKIILGQLPVINPVYPADNSTVDFSNSTVFVWNFENLHGQQDVFLDGDYIGSSNGFLNADISRGNHRWWVVGYDDAGTPVSSHSNNFNNFKIEKEIAICQLGFGFEDGLHGGATFNLTKVAPINSRIQIIAAPVPIFPIQIPGKIIGSNNFLLNNTYIGMKQGIIDDYIPGNGEFAADIFLNRISNEFIVVRSFSSSNVSDAAYFDQSDLFSPWDYDTFYPLESLVNSSVNPAYLIPPLEIYFDESDPENDFIDIYGYSYTGFDDNQLRDYDAFVEWKNLSINTSGFFNINIDLFKGNIPILKNNDLVITNHLALRTVGFSVVPDLPAGVWQHFYLPNFLSPQPPEIISPIYVMPNSSNSLVVSNLFITIEGYKFQKNEFLYVDGYSNSDIVQSLSSKKWSQLVALDAEQLISLTYFSSNILGKSNYSTTIIIDVVPEPFAFLFVLIIWCVCFFYKR